MLADQSRKTGLLAKVSISSSAVMNTTTSGHIRFAVH